MATLWQLQGLHTVAITGYTWLLKALSHRPGD